MHEPRFDLTTASFLEDPYPVYHRMRDEAPIHFDLDPDWKVYRVTRYDHVVSILRSPDFTSAKIAPELLEQMRQQGDTPLGVLATAISGMMLVKDSPDHTRLRTLVNKAFTPRVVASLEGRIQALVDELLSAHAADGEMDLIADFAAPLPVTVIAELLGISVEDRDRFKIWSDHLATFLDGSLREDGLMKAADAAAQLREYLDVVVEDRRRDPQEDLISRLTTAQDQGDVLTDDELFSTVVLILGAGHETTTNLIGNGMLALLRNREQLAHLRQAPGCGEGAVEELLRFDSPVQLTARMPVRDLEIGGVPIKTGVEVNLYLGAANRDPEMFPNPDRLDLDREERGHLAFGLGAHFCVGAALARLEARIAFTALANRLPNLELATECPPRKPGHVLRGLQALPVRF